MTKASGDPRELVRAVISALRGPSAEASLAVGADRDAAGEVRLRTDPSFALPRHPFESPWSPEAKARRQARDLSIQARLDAFRDDLKALRIAHRALTRSAIMRVVEAAEGAIFEIRTEQETRRYRLLNRAHIQMTGEFVDQLARIESITPQLPSPQIAEALRQRALEEFIAGMNRSSKPALAFDKSELMNLKDSGE